MARWPKNRWRTSAIAISVPIAVDMAVDTPPGQTR